MMKHLAACAAIALSLSLTACASAGPVPQPAIERDGKPYQFTADPGLLVATDLRFRLALQQDGFAKAAKDFAAPDAQLLSGGRIVLKDALANDIAPPAMVNIRPAEVALSCDGRSGAVLSFALDAANEPWTLLTIWNTDTRGVWNWSMISAAKSANTVMEGDIVASSVAKCGTRPPATLSAPAVGVDMQVGYAPDQTLSWTSTVTPDGATRVQVRQWDGTKMTLKLEVPSP